MEPLGLSRPDGADRSDAWGVAPAGTRVASPMAAQQPTIRDARVGDLEAIFDIYNHEVLHGTATFDTEPRVVGRDDGWLTERDANRHPVIIAEVDNRVAGWASLNPWSSR